MKRFLVAFLLLASSAAVPAPFTPPAGAAARSVSGQFIVHSSVKGPASVMPMNQTIAGDSMVLEPSFLVISCERIKQALLSELGLSSRWNGKIFIELHPVRAENEPITVSCNHFTDGWNYQLDLPQTMERRRFMRAIVQTLLLELANRNSDKRSVEIPAWLTEGLVQQLLESHETELMLSLPRNGVQGILVSPTVTQNRRVDPLEEARRVLREHPQLTLEQLSWPTEAQLAGEDAGVYRRSAQLFVDELLRFKDGRTCMAAMLTELSRCYNWQTAFLRAFKTHFGRLLDLEKWWALQVVHATGPEPAKLLPLDESRRKLDEILLTYAQVRASPGELPVRAELNLQTVISEWDFARQRRILQEKVYSLDFLRYRFAPDLTNLAAAYRQTLDNYIKQRAKTFTLPGTRSSAPTATGLVRETVRQLDALDLRRMAVKLQPTQAAVQ